MELRDTRHGIKKKKKIETHAQCFHELFKDPSYAGVSIFLKLT